MSKRKLLLIPFFLIQIGCADIKDETLTTELPAAPPSPKLFNERTLVNPIKIDKDTFYAGLLSRIVNDSYEGTFAGGIDPSDQLIFRTETITAPENDEATIRLGISKSLLNGLTKANQKPERLDDYYDIKAAVRGYSGPRDLMKFYEKVKRQEPDVKAVVGFSYPTMDKNSSLVLVYGEYYKPDTKLMKFYYQENLEDDSYEFIQIK